MLQNHMHVLHCQQTRIIKEECFKHHAESTVILTSHGKVLGEGIKHVEESLQHIQNENGVSQESVHLPNLFLVIHTLWNHLVESKKQDDWSDHLF
jgi:hypothetical protein